MTLHWLLYAFNLLAQSGALSAAPPPEPHPPPPPLTQPHRAPPLPQPHPTGRTSPRTRTQTKSTNHQPARLLYDSSLSSQSSSLNGVNIDCCTASYCVRLRLQKMKKLMIRPYEQYTGLPYRTSEKKKELLRKTTVPSTSSGSTVPPWMPEFVRAAVIQLPLPAAVRPIFLPTGTPAPS